MFVYRFVDLIDNISLKVVGFMSGGKSRIVKKYFLYNDCCFACTVCNFSWSCWAGEFFTWVNALVCYIADNESRVAVGSTS